MCILAPKETPGLSVLAFAGSIGENEIVLPRGLAYRLIGIARKGQPMSQEMQDAMPPPILNGTEPQAPMYYARPLCRE